MIDKSQLYDAKIKIFNFIKERDTRRASLQQLREKLDINDLEKVLNHLTRTGELVYSGRQYRVNGSSVMRGEVLDKKNGIKFIHLKNGKDVVISQSSNNYVLPGDKVSFRIANGEAYIFQIDERILNKQVFQVVDRGGKKSLEYTNGHFYIKVPDGALDDYMVGEYLLVDISDNTFNHVVKRFSNISDPNNRDIFIAYNHGFDDDYDDEYINELKQIKEEINDEERAKRTDFRQDTVFTIDCDNTRDIDDALSSVKRLPNGNYLFIGHIASVSEVVKFMGPIFNKAVKRGFSFYTPRSVFPLFHYLISNNVCSLNPGVDRKTKSLILEIDPEGNVVRSELVYGIINSKMKMKYSEVDKIFTDIDQLDPAYLPFVNDLKGLKELTDIMGKKLRSGKKLEFANQDYNVHFNEEGDSIKATPIESPISRGMIENAMLYMNWQYGLLMVKNELPVVFRNHDAATEESIVRAINKLEKLGYDVSVYRKTHDLQTFLEYYEDNPMDFIVVSNVILPCFGKAYYSPTNKGHSGLGLNTYAQFSSNIRRVTDLANQYSGDMYITGDCSNKDQLAEALVYICTNANQMELEADAAEKESLLYELLDIASKNVGNCFDGFVSDIRYGKAFVRLENGVYGTIDNESDYFSLGDKIFVKIEDVNYNKKEVNLSFFGMIQSKKPKKNTKGKTRRKHK